METAGTPAPRMRTAPREGRADGMGGWEGHADRTRGKGGQTGRTDGPGPDRIEGIDWF